MLKPGDAAGGLGRVTAGRLAAGLLAVVGILFLWEVAAVGGVPLARDMQLFFVPQRKLLWEALQRWELPLWTPYIGTGHPLLAGFQSGVFYPPHWAYALLPFFPAFNGLLVLHLLLGGLGTYLLCRHGDFDPPAAWVGAASFMLGGYFASLTNLLNVLQAAAWVPLMIWALASYAEEGGRGFPLLATVYLLAFLAGDPQVFLVGSLLAVAYALACGPAAGRGGSGKTRLRVLKGISAAAVVVAAVGMIQILPTLEMVLHSTRAGGLPLEQAVRYTLVPLRLVHLVVPPEYGDPVYPFGRKAQLTESEPWLFSVYLGVVTLVLAWHAGRGGRRREVGFWGAAAAVGLLLALGDHTPVFPWLFEHVPGFSAFRYPERYFLLTGLGVAMLAAHGLAALRAGGPESRRPQDPWAAGATLAAGAGLLLWWTLDPRGVLEVASGLLGQRAPFVENFEFAHREWTGNLLRCVVLVFLAVGLVALHRRDHLTRRTFTSLLCLLVAVDLGLAHRSLTPVADPSFYEGSPEVAEELPFGDVRSAYRYRASPYDERLRRYWTFPDVSHQTHKWYWKETLQPSLGAYWSVQTDDSDGAIHLRRAAQRGDLLRLASERERWRILRLSSVKYLYSPEPQPEGEYLGRAPLEGVPGSLYTVRDPVPRAYLARPTFVEDRFEAAGAFLDSAFAPARDVAVVADSAELSLLPGDAFGAGGDRVAAVGGPALPPRGEGPGGAEIVADRREEIRVRVEPERAAFLVLTDTHYPGWEARVDGERRHVYAANHFFRGVPVLPGEREVVLRYDPTWFRAGAAISGGSLLAILVLALLRRVARSGSGRRGEG